MHLDAEGFYRPVVDSEKCVQCGACEKVCPWANGVLNPNGASKTPKTVAAYSLDESIRMNSSSGGIFSVLAEKFLDDGGVVAGVAQLDKTHFGHVVVDNKADLAKLRGSKYVQADAGMVYREIRSLLREGRKVLFSGTPCQVAALYSVLGQKTFENLFTVDIVCHGTPSVRVFQKYVEDLERQEQSEVVENVFRDKTDGWKRYSLLHKLANGSQNLVSHGESKYMRLFLSRICQNSSCADCRYRKLPRIADITLGDYWGITSVHPEMDDDKGTSVVLLNTAHGETLFSSILDKLKICDSFLDKAIAGNPCIVRSSIQHTKRAEFFAELDTKSLDELLKKFCPQPSLLVRVYRKIRGILGRSIVGKIKRRLMLCLR